VLKATARYFGTLAGVLLVIVFGVSACWNMAYPTNSFRYRLTVEVETPEGVKSGSSVIEVTERAQPRFGDAPSSQMSIKGEAVTVNLGSRGQIFVLLKNGSRQEGFVSEAGMIAYSAFPNKNSSSGRGAEALPENLKRYRDERLVAQLTPEQMPLMVRFRDIRDPMSVERVDPDNMAALFGDHVRLKRSKIETTDLPISMSVHDNLKWLSGLNGRYLHGGSSGRNAPLGLSVADFVLKD